MPHCKATETCCRMKERDCTSLDTALTWLPMSANISDYDVMMLLLFRLSAYILCILLCHDCLHPGNPTSCIHWDLLHNLFTTLLPKIDAPTSEFIQYASSIYLINSTQIVPVLCTTLCPIQGNHHALHQYIIFILICHPVFPVPTYSCL